MALERQYTIPLRKEFQKAPMYRRAKKAVNAVKAFMERHMKPETLLIGPVLNEKIWERGITNPPHHVKVTAIKDDKGVVRVELFGFEFKEKEKKEKKPKATGLAGKLQEKLAAGEDKAEKKEARAEKKEEKAEAKAEKKEDKPKAAAPKPVKSEEKKPAAPKAEKPKAAPKAPAKKE